MLELGGCGSSSELLALTLRQMETGDRIILNVGGRRFETYRETLQRRPNTRLGQMFAMLSQPRSAEEYFFDRNPRCFAAILDWYRTKRLLVPEGIPLKVRSFPLPPIVVGLTIVALLYSILDVLSRTVLLGVPGRERAGVRMVLLSAQKAVQARDESGTRSRGNGSREPQEEEIRLHP